MENTLNKVIELTNFQNQTIDFESLTQAGYDTVLLECGGGNTSLSQDTPLKYFETHYNQAIAANFKIGYFFWVYSNVDPKIQAQEYFNLVKDKKADCKLMLDVETGSVKNTKTGVYYGYYNNMSIEEITIGIIEELKILMSESGLSNINDEDFIVYSSRGFFEENLANILDKYPLWVADPTGVSPNIDTNIVYNGKILNWTGYQWIQDTPFTGVGTSCDLDVFKSEAFFSTPIIFGESTGPLSSGGSNDLKIGTDVKITSGTNFAPNLIPSSDKEVKYTIDSINGSMCKLSEINEWVDFEDLSLIQSPSQKSFSNFTNTAIYQYYKSHEFNDSSIENIINNAIQICKYFKHENWTLQAICGMLGNFSIEDPNLNPTTWEEDMPEWGPQTGYGIAQWTPATDLTKICEILGVAYDKLSSQCEAIQYEMTHDMQFYPSPTSSLNASEYMNSMISAYELGMVWLANYERPKSLNQSVRGQLAENWFELLKNIS